MAMPRSMTVVHAGLSRVLDKTFPPISNSGTHNYRGCLLGHTSPRGRRSPVCHPAKSQNNIAHKLVAPRTLNLTTHQLALSSSQRLILLLYPPCPIPERTHVALSRDILRFPTGGVCSCPFTSWPELLPPGLPNISFRVTPQILLLHLDVPSHIQHPRHVFMCVARPCRFPRHSPQGCVILGPHNCPMSSRSPVP